MCIVCFKCHKKKALSIIKSLTAAGLHADLQAQVVHWAHYPQVAGGSDVKLQPALLSCPQPARVQQEQVCLSGRTWEMLEKKCYHYNISHLSGAQTDT